MKYYDEYSFTGKCIFVQRLTAGDTDLQLSSQITNKTADIRMCSLFSIIFYMNNIDFT